MRKHIYISEEAINMLVKLSADEKKNHSSMIEKLIRDAHQNKDKTTGDGIVETVKALQPALRSIDKNTATVLDLLNSYFHALTENGIIEPDQFQNAVENPHEWVLTSQKERSERIRRAQINKVNR